MSKIGVSRARVSGLLCATAALLMGCGVDTVDSEPVSEVNQAAVSCFSYPQWVFNTPYASGQHVQNRGFAYKCKDVPGWCQQQEPGVWPGWESAWERVDKCCGIVINEAQTNKSSAPSDDFVEIANTCSTSRTLTNHKLVYRATAGTTDVTVLWLNGVVVPGGGYAWFHGIQYTGDRTTANGHFGAALSGTGGGLAIIDNSGKVVDAFGYGTATNIYIEGTRAAAAPRGNSMARIPDKQDTDNNLADIQIGTPTPGAANF